MHRLLRLAPLAIVPLGAAAWALLARADEPAARARPAPPPATGVVHLRGPDGPPRVDTGRVDAHGAPVLASCGTCHATRAPDVGRRTAPEHFHQGLRLAHGGLSCLSCHDGGDHDRLRLADGTPLPFTQVLDLCSQCHGTQRRDFDHGAHGGMSGHWDLSRGDRTRAVCTACHDPHSPAYAPAMPVFAPRDAYQVRGREGARHE